MNTALKITAAPPRALLEFGKGSVIRAVRRLPLFLLIAVLAAAAGCATDEGKKRDEFFTSGSREADQRASQRMAKEEQLAGSGEENGARAREENGNRTLYERLGGDEGLVAIVDDFTDRALQDPRVNWSREGMKRRGWLFGRNRNDSAMWNPTPENIASLKKHLVQFLALATGGPAQYDGKDMQAAHSGMRISNAEFDAAIGDLKASLDKLRIPDREQKELLAIVESTRPQIVSER